MGILNVTPDSFSDGGRYVSVEAAVSRAAAMLSNGAAIIDIGGESTRPGADPVSAGEEADRVVPVVEALHERFPDARLSIDTYKPSVAAAALEAGAHIINDVTGLRLHPEMAAVVAAHDAALIVMLRLKQPIDNGQCVNAVGFGVEVGNDAVPQHRTRHPLHVSL